MKCSYHDDVVLVSLWVGPYQRISFHAHAQIKGRDHILQVMLPLKIADIPVIGNVSQGSSQQWSADEEHPQWRTHTLPILAWYVLALHNGAVTVAIACFS